jgi:hypothetical protein
MQGFDTGNSRLYEHMSIDMEIWITPNSSEFRLKYKNLDESSCEFTRGPLIRQPR